jgi:hypothetical protein
LVETADRHPDLRVVVKLRGDQGEAQTHAEKHPFDALLAELEHRPSNLVVDRGAMSSALARARGLATVSSTAAIEAVAAGIPVIALDDFGVGPDLINTVFEGSGLLASSERLLAARFAHPHPEWFDDNYFHGGSERPGSGTSFDELVALADLRDRGELALRRQFRGTLGGALRRVWDRKRALGPFDRSAAGVLALAVGLPLRLVVLAARAVRRLVVPTSGATEAHFPRSRAPGPADAGATSDRVAPPLGLR